MKQKRVVEGLSLFNTVVDVKIPVLGLLQPQGLTNRNG